VIGSSTTVTVMTVLASRLLRVSILLPRIL
jgi:hypothetical protein